MGFGAPPDHLLSIQVAPSGDTYGQQQRLAIYWAAVIREVSSLPGVDSAALSIWLPPNHAAMSDSFEIQRKTPPDGGPEIVGVVADVKYEGAGSPDEPVYYESSSQVLDRPMWLVVRTHDDPHRLIPAIRNRVAAIHGNVPISHIGTMDESMYASVALPRFRSILMGAFALIALLLATIGIYGVMSYSVLQRTQELAIRLALGATRANVIGRVVGYGIFLALCGIMIGSVGALAFVRTLRSMLFNVSPSDPAIFSGVALLLFAVAVTASYIPALRAARKDPLRALRRE